MGMAPEGRDDHAVGRTAVPLRTEDLVRVLSRALVEGGRRIHLTAGQRRAILGVPLRAGWPGAGS